MKMAGFWRVALSCRRPVKCFRSSAGRITMPELPEVETMVRGLRPALQGRFVDRLEVHDPFLVQGCEAQELERRVCGVAVAEVVRRGKWVVISLSDGRGIIVIQPRMTGGF